jgi:hypothetical protein
VRLARAATVLRRFVLTPTVGSGVAAGVRLTPTLDPRVAFLAKVVGYAVPGTSARSKDLDPPIERDLPPPGRPSEPERER